jgi:nucleoside-diphosphate-sugar epimerase
MKENKTIVVLGGGGYIGSTLIDLLLKENFKVLAIDNFFKGSCDNLIPFLSNNNFKFAFGDVTNPEDMKKLLVNADIIINLAALVGFPICRKYPDLAKRVNVYGMENVLKYRPTLCPILFSSTGSVYGEVLDGIATEETTPNPLSIYGKTKLEAEKLALAEDHTIVYRFATLFGVGFATTRVDLLLNDFCYQCYNNKSLVVFQSFYKRNFIHVGDVCQFIIHNIKNYFKMYGTYRLYNVGNESQNYSKADLCNIIKEYIPFHLTLAETHTDEDRRNYSFSSIRAYNSGWEPKIDVREGIKEMIKFIPMMKSWKDYS